MKFQRCLPCLRLGVLLGWAILPASGQAQPADPAPIQHSAQPAATAVPATQPHHVRRHARHPAHVRHSAPPPPPHPAAQAPTPAPYSEAPTPNADLLPPHEYIPPATSVIPGTLQLHYPPSGSGYVTGSSPQALDDDRTAKVPGLTLHVPLQPAAPPPMPPPQDPMH